MRDTLAILRKECLELAGERDTRRGGAIQLLVMTVVLGVIVPLRRAAQWDQWNATVVMPYVVIGTLLSAGVAADAFAGERERRTLATLLTTPASEFDILLGKACAVVLFGLTIALVPWAVTLVVATVRGVPWGPVVPLTAACIWLTVCSSFSFGTIAIGTSLQTTSARASQQISSVVILVVFAAGSYLWQELSLPLTLSAFCVGGAVALVWGGLGLFVLSRRFRRERLFARS
jgi:ABC-2 type transport system permease protein